MKSRISLNDRARLGLLSDKDKERVELDVNNLKKALDAQFGKPVVMVDSDVLATVRNVGIARVQHTN